MRGKRGDNPFMIPAEKTSQRKDQENDCSRVDPGFSETSHLFPVFSILLLFFSIPSYSLYSPMVVST